MQLTDSALEREIQAALKASQQAQTEGRTRDAHEHWAIFVYLVGRRSPQQVQKMERERGLV